MGVAQEPAPTAGSTPPQGTYAMGALAGNPMLGAGPASSFGGPPPTDPGAPMWSAPPPPAAAPAAGNHRVRNGLLAGAAAIAVLGAGFGIGHATSNNGEQHAGLQPDVGQLAAALGLRSAPAARAPRAAPSATARPSERRLLRGLGELGQHRQLGQRQFGIVELIGPE